MKVAFDIGNVLCHVDLLSFNNFTAKDLGLFDSIEKANDFLASIQAAQDLGLYNIRQGFSRFNPKLSEKQLNDIRDLWMDILIPSKPMFNLIERLISDKNEVALLSNIGYDHSARVRTFPLVDKCIQHFSFKVGARKPTSLFFQVFKLQNPSWFDPKILSLSNSSWCYNPPFFFDDKEENVKAADKFLCGIQFDLDNFKNDDEAKNHIEKMIYE